MKEIKLTQGQVAIVDDEDFEHLSQFKWTAQWDKRTKGYYAYRKQRMANGKRHTVSMHREIMGLKLGDLRQVDHEDHNGLNNRRFNLRTATRSQNCQNRRKPAHNSSGYKGIYFNAVDGVWTATIAANGKRRYLGRRKTAEAAYLELYVPAALAFHGEFARVA